MHDSLTPPRAGLPGPSRTITIEPVEQPARAPEPLPAEPAERPAADPVAPAEVPEDVPAANLAACA